MLILSERSRATSSILRSQPAHQEISKMPPPSFVNGHVSQESPRDDAGLRSDSAVYKTLQQNEIRIVEIDPVTADSRSEQVSGRLIHHPRDKPPAYQALSYSWGRPSEREKGHILLDGIKHPVTETLEAALRRLRHEDGQNKLLIWVDALCINQTDLDEKAREVRRMRSIYQRAEQVSVWLGEHSKNSPLAWTLLRKLHDASDDSDLKTVIQNARLEFQTGAFDALKDLFRREYWWRIWVVQEVNSNENTVVFCGEDHMSWSDLLQVSGRIEEATEIIMEEIYHDQPHSVYTLTSGGPKNLRIQRHSNTKADEKKGSPLVDLLYSHESKLSTEDVDKVYALVGLSSDRETFGAIDYGLSARLVYIHTAKYIITQTESLNVICRHNNDDNPCLFHLGSRTGSADFCSLVTESCTCKFDSHRMKRLEPRKPNSLGRHGRITLRSCKYQASQYVPSRT
jgi:hypothetical protein